MSQQKMNRHNKQKINATFHMKSAGSTLVAILIIGIYYVAHTFTMSPSDEAVPENELRLIINAIVLIGVVELVLQMVLFIGAGQIEAWTERENMIATHASRNVYTVLPSGVFATFATMFIEFTPFEMALS